MNGNVEIHVLSEKLTATVALNFTRCHLNTIDNCHVITIIFNTVDLGLILTWTRINVFRCIAYCIIHLVILFNIFILYCIVLYYEALY